MANYNSLKNAGLLKPVANTDLGSPTNTYGNLYMSGNVSLNGTLLNSTNAITPRIASITYLGDDTAAAPAGGATITVTGSGFSTGSAVYVGGTIASAVTVVSSTQITFIAPVKTAGSYSLNVVNTDGATATFIPGMQYSGVPVWSTSAGSLGSAAKSTSASFSVAATGDAPISYSVFSGSLPSGVSLNTSTGVITGTTPNETATTTYNFTIRATDAQNQDTDRAFSLTVTAGLSSVEMLVVAGGGGSPGRAGNATASGGGGAGGVVIHPTRSITTGVSYTITVGAGGTVRTDVTGNSGNDTIFGSNIIVAKGGGGGGSYQVGIAGGSGGGGGYQNEAGGASTQNTLGVNGGGTGYGNAGGAADAYGTGSAGGGGAGAVGGTTSTASGASGGVGIVWPSGSGTYYGGGGGGGGAYGGGTGAGGSGGLGGGGNGGAKTSGDPGSYSGTNPNGTANTGGGGGASSGGASPQGSAGGSGVVIIRYADSFSAASTTGSPTVTTTGGYRVYKFTSSGSITF